MHLWKKIKPPLEAAERLHFIEGIFQAFFDWRSWAALLGGSAMTFLWAAIDGRSPLDVWVLAVVVGAGLAIIVSVAIGLWQYLRSVKNDTSFTNNQAPQVVAGQAAALECFFNMNDSGCVRPNTKLRRKTDGLSNSTNSAVVTGGIVPDIQSTTVTVTGGRFSLSGPISETPGTYYCVKVSAEGNHVSECKGRLEWMWRGSLLLIGEPVLLPFARAEAADALNKLIHVGAPEHLDFLFISDANRAELTSPNFTGSSSIPWDTLFAATGDYTFQIKILSPTATASIDLLFRWTGKRETSEIIQTA